MKLSKINKITKIQNQKCYDLTIENNHNFFCNNFLIHNCLYRGEIGVVLINLSQENVKINKNDKIAQIIFQQCAYFKFNVVEDLDSTTRNENGFGSTTNNISSTQPSLADLYNKSGGIPIKEKYLEEIKKREVI